MTTESEPVTRWIIKLSAQSGEGLLFTSQFPPDGVRECQQDQANLAELAAPIPVSSESISSLELIEAGLLDMRYAEPGLPSGPLVILPHDWPEDIRSFGEIGLLLAQSFCVILRYLREFGTIIIVASGYLGDGLEPVVAHGILALMGVFKIEKAIITSFQWRARTVGAIATFWSKRRKALVSLSG